MNYLSPLHAFKKNSNNSPVRSVLFVNPLIEVATGPEKLGKLLKVPQPVGDRLGLAVLLSDVCSDHYSLWGALEVVALR